MIIKVLDQALALKNSRALLGFNYCEQIYKLEKELREAYSSKENYYDIRFKVRNEKLTQIIGGFIDYVEREIKDALPRSPLGKSLDYAKKHLPGLRNVLLDGSFKRNITKISLINILTYYDEREKNKILYFNINTYLY